MLWKLYKITTKAFTTFPKLHKMHGRTIVTTRPYQWVVYNWLISGQMNLSTYETFAQTPLSDYFSLFCTCVGLDATETTCYDTMQYVCKHTAWARIVQYKLIPLCKMKLYVFCTAYNSFTFNPFSPNYTTGLKLLFLAMFLHLLVIHALQLLCPVFFIRCPEIFKLPVMVTGNLKSYRGKSDHAKLFVDLSTLFTAG